MARARLHALMSACANVTISALCERQIMVTNMVQEHEYIILLLRSVSAVTVVYCLRAVQRCAVHTAMLLKE